LANRLVIHTTITPTNQTISLDIPKIYVGKQIVIIAFAKDEGCTDERSTKKR
jgi:putative transposon-encoded protein